MGFLLQDTGLDWDACIADVEARGFAAVMRGSWRGVSFCYFQTEDALKTTFELIYRPEGYQRPPPLYWYPPQG